MPRLGRKPQGTIAYLGGVWALPADFCWAWGQMVQYNEEFLSSDLQYIHYMRTTFSDHAPARNDLANRFLGDWLLQLDTDHVFEPDVCGRLLRFMENAEVQVVAGLYRYKKPPYSPVYQVPGENGENKPIANFVGEPPDLLQVSGGGGGCLLVKREVFNRIREELQEQPFDRLPGHSEDQSFFARLRKLSIKAYLAPRVECWHLRAVKVDEKDAVREAEFIGSSKEPLAVGGYDCG